MGSPPCLLRWGPSLPSGITPGLSKSSPSLPLTSSPSPKFQSSVLQPPLAPRSSSPPSPASHLILALPRPPTPLSGGTRPGTQLMENPANGLRTIAGAQPHCPQIAKTQWCLRSGPTLRTSEQSESEQEAAPARKVSRDCACVLTWRLRVAALPRPACSFFSETYCLPRPAGPQAPGRNVTSCNVAITAKAVPARGTPARGAWERCGASASAPAGVSNGGGAGQQEKRAGQIPIGKEVLAKGGFSGAVLGVMTPPERSSLPKAWSDRARGSRNWNLRIAPHPLASRDPKSERKGGILGGKEICSFIFKEVSDTQQA